MTDILETPTVTIVGAGAIGVEQAGRLAHHQLAKVTVIAKPDSERFTAVKERGLQVRLHFKEEKTGILVAPDQFTILDRLTQLNEKQDIALITAKTYDFLTENFKENIINTLYKHNSEIVWGLEQNGIPIWWNSNTLFHNHHFSSDPEGTFLEALHIENIIPMVIYTTNRMQSAGIAEIMTPTPKGEEDGRFYVVLGEIDGSESTRVKKLKELFDKAGMSARISKDIRYDILRKVILNIVGCIAGVMGMPLDKALAIKEAAELTEQAIEETLAIGKEWGIHINETAAEFIAMSKKLIGYEPSILQDIRLGKPTEIIPIVGHMIEMGSWTQNRTIALEAIASFINKITIISRNANTREKRELDLHQLWSTEAKVLCKDAIYRVKNEPIDLSSVNKPNFTNQNAALDIYLEKILDKKLGHLEKSLIEKLQKLLTLNHLDEKQSSKVNALETFKQPQHSQNSSPSSSSANSLSSSPLSTQVNSPASTPSSSDSEEYEDLNTAELTNSNFAEREARGKLNIIPQDPNILWTQVAKLQEIERTGRVHIYFAPSAEQQLYMKTLANLLINETIVSKEPYIHSQKGYITIFSKDAANVKQFVNKMIEEQKEHAAFLQKEKDHPNIDNKISEKETYARQGQWAKLISFESTNRHKAPTKT